MDWSARSAAADAAWPSAPCADKDDAQRLRFHPARRLTRQDVADVLPPRPCREARDSVRGPCQARQGGFDLHAGLVARAGQRARFEQLCRYALRPPLAEDRLDVDAAGDFWLRLRHPWADGTTHLRFDPLELLGRLAVLTPRPRINLVLYHDVLAPRARWPGFGEASPRRLARRRAGSTPRSVRPVAGGCGSWP
jgi:hypothetical protein